MTQAITRYNALFDSVRSRRRRPRLSRGLDGLAVRAAVAVRNRKVTPSWLRSQAERIDAMSAEVRNYSEGVLDGHVGDIREVFIRGRQDEQAVRRALALVREVARRQTGEEPFVVQLMAALAMYHGRIVEMLTGEGKTLTGSIVAPLLAWQHRHVHIFTVNDYLARRDAHSRQGIYRRCLLAAGAITQEMPPGERFDVYAMPIVYGTPKQITADWLRDQIRLGAQTTVWKGRQNIVMGGGGRASSTNAGPMIPGLRAALVDEADAVLIDEGVVPLIIAQSRRADDMAEVYRSAARIAAMLDEGPDYSIDHLRRRAEIKTRGRHRCHQIFETLQEPIWRAQRRAEEMVRQGLVARHCYIRGHQYQIVDGRVMIVDEYTGRFLPDRNWEHGLHQAVEAKEGVEVTADRETLARMSFQRFYRTYPFLCGMTGTAADATSEMEQVYSRPVVVIPTNKPVVRVQMPLRIFKTSDSRWAAVVQSIEELHAAGRPVLVGSRSIEASEIVSQRLSARGLQHRVLNANFDKEEADLICDAGRGGLNASITVATNMAGRGTDIKPDEAAIRAGGLHVMLTEMHGAKRIDRQFIGRAGRQGDPGSAQIFVSLEDELVRLHAPRAASWLKRASPGPELAGRLRDAACGVFRLAQRSAEARARRGRASVLRQDDWIEKYLPGQ
jgi:preprotein translocase subunit SecA